MEYQGVNIKQGEALTRMRQNDEVIAREREKKAEARANRKKKGSDYNDWVQVNLARKVMGNLDTIAKNPSAMRVFLFIMEKMDNYNALVCSQSVIAEALDISRQSVYTSIKFLKDKGFLFVKRTGRSNVYLLNDEVAWKSWSNNKRYCEFPANVILAESEQEEIELSKKILVDRKE